MTFSLTAVQQAYMTDQMNRVSRSFALVAPAVDEPLNDYLAAAYLICRVVDNIEDCTMPFAWQQERFVEFATLLQDPAQANEILAFWGDEAWPGLTRDEARMMSVAGGQMLWQIYAQIPEEPRASIARWALVMAKGMEQVINPHLTKFFF